LVTLKRVLIGLLVAGVVALLLGFWFAKSLLCVEAAPRGDVIVVAGWAQLNSEFGEWAVWSEK
jgi:hypothetical protein